MAIEIQNTTELVRHDNTVAHLVWARINHENEIDQLFESTPAHEIPSEMIDAEIFKRRCQTVGISLMLNRAASLGIETERRTLREVAMLQEVVGDIKRSPTLSNIWH